MRHMLSGGDLAFALLALNPFGGMMLALPFAFFKLDYSVPHALLLGIPLSYVQVLVVQLGWTTLSRWPAFNRFLEKRRSPRIERLTQSRGAFWATVIISPMIGPWIVMAFMRYANVPFRRVALPLLLGLCWNGSAIAAVCQLAPALLNR